MKHRAKKWSKGGKPGESNIHTIKCENGHEITILKSRKTIRCPYCRDRKDAATGQWLNFPRVLPA